MFRAGIEPALRCAAIGCLTTAPTMQTIQFDVSKVPNLRLTARLVRWLANRLPRDVQRVRFPHGAVLCVIHELLFPVWVLYSCQTNYNTHFIMSLLSGNMEIRLLPYLTSTFTKNLLKTKNPYNARSEPGIKSKKRLTITLTINLNLDSF
ncbi:hypothetical protein SFRURICE_012219 [Spodoptera frugiperda]|nr:hypothetical protein SFRURICE_012219 [Spodoptera frugiperda]